MNVQHDDRRGPRVTRKRNTELLVILALGVAVYVASARSDLLETIVRFAHQHEEWQVDEIIVMAMFLAIAMTWFAMQRWTETQQSERLLAHRNETLERALGEIQQLRGILPICASCKKIRDEQGYWHQVEAYIRDHTEADFSHAICPDCMRKLYPGIVLKGNGTTKNSTASSDAGSAGQPADA